MIVNGCEHEYGGEYIIRNDHMFDYYQRRCLFCHALDPEWLRIVRRNPATPSGN